MDPDSIFYLVKQKAHPLCLIQGILSLGDRRTVCSTRQCRGIPSEQGSVVSPKRLESAGGQVMGCAGSPPTAGTASASASNWQGRLFMMPEVAYKGRTAQKKSAQVSEAETTKLHSMNIVRLQRCWVPCIPCLNSLQAKKLFVGRNLWVI